jgi:type II secretory pathway predicted ATPase ExeA
VSAAPWAAHFGLARTPFGKSIPARDLFPRQAHAEAIARIGFCVVESALGVVTGDVGAGKTVALRAAVAGLDPTRHQVIYIANPAFGTRGLHVTIVRALGAQPRYLKAELMAQAGDLLAAEAAGRHRRVVVICDEAHLLQPDQLEELRLLTNSEMDSAGPFAGILAGQPTLNRQLRMGTFAALDQRIATRFTVKPMDLAESAAYLRHHLKLAGRDEPLFAGDAIARLHRVANGLPRALNNAAVAALIAAAAAGKDLIDDACAKKAVAELTRDRPCPRQASWRPRPPQTGRRRAVPDESRPRRPAPPARRPGRAPPRHRRIPRPPRRRPAGPASTPCCPGQSTRPPAFSLRRKADTTIPDTRRQASRAERTVTVTHQQRAGHQPKPSDSGSAVHARPRRYVNTESRRIMCKQRGR